MNKAPLVIRTSVPAPTNPTPDPSSANSRGSSPNRSTFAGTLSRAGSLPSRKPSEARRPIEKHSGAGVPTAGSERPSGNAPPPMGLPLAGMPLACAASLPHGSLQATHRADQPPAAGDALAPASASASVGKGPAFGTSVAAARAQIQAVSPAGPGRSASAVAAAPAGAALSASLAGPGGATDPVAPAMPKSSDPAAEAPPIEAADSAAATMAAGEPVNPLALSAKGTAQATAVPTPRAAAPVHATGPRWVAKALGKTGAVRGADTSTNDAGDAEPVSGEAPVSSTGAASTASARSVSTPIVEAGSASAATAVSAATAASTTAAASAAADAGVRAPAGTAEGDGAYDSDAAVAAQEKGAPAVATTSKFNVTGGPTVRSQFATAGVAATPDLAAGRVATGGTVAGGAGAAPAVNAPDVGGLAPLNTAGVAVGSAADPVPLPTLRVHAEVGSGEFAQGLLDRVSYMVKNDVNGAKLQVNPPQLGPIELHISVQGDHAQVWMTTHSALARDALEASSPRLREMLSAQGFGQVSVDISQRSFQDRSAYTAPYTGEAPGDQSRSGTRAAVVSPAPRVAQGTLDAYA